MYLYFTRMFILVCTRVLLVCTRMLLVCTRMLLVCYSHVLVCTCVLLVCYSYVLVWCFSHDLYLYRFKHLQNLPEFFNGYFIQNSECIITILGILTNCMSIIVELIMQNILLLIRELKYGTLLIKKLCFTMLLLQYYVLFYF